MTTGFEELPDLASRLLGGGVVAVNDEFFAAADNLVNPTPPAFTPGVFGPKGQVYDGWETRRRREPGHDYVVIRLGSPGVVSGIDVDTAFFTGNYPPYGWVDGCTVDGYPSPAELAAARWTTLVPRSALRGNTHNEFTVDVPDRITHVRLAIEPDGGVARLRVHGIPVPDPLLQPGDRVDLAAAGGEVVACSDMYYGAPQNLLLPGFAGSMGEGWETRRRRDEDNDWVVVRLARPGRIELAELDTSHFKGNAPAAASLRGFDAGAGDLDDASAWFELLPRVRLQPDTRHRFPVAAGPVATHVRLDVYPDGGMARLRLYGTPF
ncbi:MAG TPA: allantoicase [Micromonosporaceae bacterium]|jgi:allantoicase|nr:allantoicase [Micromonosporaceae bacterium]